MSPEDCRANLLKGNYFGTMLVKMGLADAKNIKAKRIDAVLASITRQLGPT